MIPNHLFKLCLTAAIVGHLLCGFTDCLLTYLPNGRFKFEYMKDNEKLSKAFRDMPPKNTLMAMLLGCLAMFLLFFGYLALGLWMWQYSAVCSVLMIIGCGLICTFGMAHHEFCGMPEWLYIKLGRTEEARVLITDFFRQTSITMVICYIGFLVFGAALFIAVVAGLTPLPRWACVFNVLVLMIVLVPTRVGGSGNWAGAIMFAGLLLLR